MNSLAGLFMGFFISNNGDAMSKTYKDKNCKQCGNTFKTTGPNQYYCSPICQFYGTGYTKDSKGCHIWNGSYRSDGYTQLTFRSKNYKAYRLSCEMAHGPAPTPLENNVLHACDNPSCVNPDHLRWGTHQENMDDRKKRNRENRQTKLKGTQIPSSKLDIIQVKEIKKKLEKCYHGMIKDLSKQYNVSTTTIHYIKTGVTWNHV